VAQRTLVLVKPDGVKKGLIGEIISRLEKKGLKIAAMKMLQMDKALARRHYAVHDGKPFFADLVDFITSGPIVAVVVEGEKSVEVVRKLMGETDPVKAAPGTIRGDYGLDIGENLIHGSDSEENAQNEIALFFPDLKPAK
jgi:nucleoside-diphosphate kinase